MQEYEEQMDEAHQKLQDSLKVTSGLLDTERQKNQTLQKEMSARTKQLIAARDRNEQIEAMHKAVQQEKQAEIASLSAKVRLPTFLLWSSKESSNDNMINTVAL